VNQVSRYRIKIDPEVCQQSEIDQILFEHPAAANFELPALDDLTSETRCGYVHKRKLFGQGTAVTSRTQLTLWRKAITPTHLRPLFAHSPPLSFAISLGFEHALLASGSTNDHSFRIAPSPTYRKAKR
jgi:hypothetical protein